ncbi:S-adenosyl-L-methionine-dependent methyltransferase [Apodospora peruviana]|uniref:S-adenosyl-L-methionine-dependent methyltransferase n=1 Tax=Apodospora peruviana TaxID=516989 RepID=A0AAE0HTK5_9PEZI|nr:S-adenosyl-L-methionine-dependent methyltransferase [Apodospora peruviana]
MASEQQQDQEYLFALAESELKRLSMQHAWIQKCLDNQLIFAPVNLRKPGLKVLDVGCADGTLLCDLQPQLDPSAQLVGVDNMSSFLPKEPTTTNISYVVHDVCEPFVGADMKDAFDLTHVRLVLPGAGRVGIPAAIKNLIGSLAPGGWLQVQEFDFSDDDDAPRSIKDLQSVVRRFWQAVGIEPGFVHELAALFEEAGLVNVGVKKVVLSVGKKMGDEAACANSIEPFKLTIPSIVGAATAMGVELPNEAVENLAERFEQEMRDEGGSFKAVIVWGQKPVSA